jgi:thiamine-monophosphate kinase
MRIEELGEFGLIDRIRKRLPTPGPDVLVGIGDDVAVLEGGAGRVWLATCDVQVQGVHFLLHQTDPRNLGRKALAINLSDVAAKGGTPRFALVSLGLPREFAVEFIDQLYDGLRAEADQYGVSLVGGNITRSPLGLFVDITLIGEAPRENVVLRSGARPGDRILVTGNLGDAAAGLELLIHPEARVDAAYAEFARTRLVTPTPRVAVGQHIGASHLATAMMDVSDGLASDLAHICDNSQVGARVSAEQLPVLPENRKLALAQRGDEWSFALRGGEDYELLFTAPAAAANTLADEITHATGCPVSIIGTILSADEGRQLILPDGRSVPLEPGGWDHLNEENS